MSELLSQQALAERLGVPLGTLTDWRYRNKGPAFVRIGKHIRYRTTDVEAWLDAQTVTTKN